MLYITSSELTHFIAKSLYPLTNTSQTPTAMLLAPGKLPFYIYLAIYLCIYLCMYVSIIYLSFIYFRFHM